MLIKARPLPQISWFRTLYIPRYPLLCMDCEHWAAHENSGVRTFSAQHSSPRNHRGPWPQRRSYQDNRRCFDPLQSNYIKTKDNTKCSVQFLQKFKLTWSLNSKIKYRSGETPPELDGTHHVTAWNLSKISEKIPEYSLAYCRDGWAMAFLSRTPIIKPQREYFVDNWL